VQGPGDGGNIVERCLYGLNTLGTVRFGRLNVSLAPAGSRDPQAAIGFGIYNCVTRLPRF